MNLLRLRLPATSANLGPGFDTLALALKLYLEIEAKPAEDTLIRATGRDAAVCGALENNMLLRTYERVLAEQGRKAPSLAIRMRNEIPLGMGCGSSAAVRLAAVALASYFGKLGWDRMRMLTEAAQLEGHPDNVAASWLGGFVVSGWEGRDVRAIRMVLPREWRAVLVIPETPLATSASRAILPESYSRSDAVANLQNVAMLTAALAARREDLVAAAMGDRLHQPYRGKECPLLPALLPLAGRDGVLGVALSGAGPGVLLLVQSEAAARKAVRRARAAVRGEAVRVLVCELEREAASFWKGSKAHVRTYNFGNRN
jgi:homoserine kinase